LVVVSLFDFLLYPFFEKKEEKRGEKKERKRGEKGKGERGEKGKGGREYSKFPAAKRPLT
jgi:hypothetical protein